MWVLRIKPESSARAASGLKHWASSPTQMKLLCKDHWNTISLERAAWKEGGKWGTLDPTVWCSLCKLVNLVTTKALARTVSSGNRFCIRAESLTSHSVCLFYFLFSLCFLFWYQVKFQVAPTVPQWSESKGFFYLLFSLKVWEPPAH